LELADAGHALSVRAKGDSIDDLLGLTDFSVVEAIVVDHLE
jgi:hypothetical protein